MSSLDASIIVVGLPTVINELNTSLAAGIWIITAYRLMTTVLLVSIGRLADLIGRVKLYKLGFAVFTIGSALCALSPNAGLLITFRLLQGAGAALLFVNSMAIVTDAFPSKQLGTGIGINQMAINAGTIVGYTLSGVLIGLYGWRSLFIVNLPVGVFGTYWAHRRLKEMPRSNHGEKFDLTGAAVFSAGLTILLLAMTVGDITQIVTQLTLLVSVLILALFVWWERRADHPVMDMKLFRIREYTIGNMTNLLNGISFGSLAFAMTIYFQIARHFSPVQAGLALIPLDVTLIVVGPLSGRLSDRFGARWLSTIGLAISGFSFLLLATLSWDTTELVITGMLAAAGFGIGFFRSPNASSVMASVPPERRGIAAGVRSTVINTSIAVSIPFATLIMSAIIPFGPLSRIIAGGTPSASEQDLLLAALRGAFIVFATINFLAAAISPIRGASKKRAILTREME